MVVVDGLREREAASTEDLGMGQSLHFLFDTLDLVRKGTPLNACNVYSRIVHTLYVPADIFYCHASLSAHFSLSSTSFPRLLKHLPQPTSLPLILQPLLQETLQIGPELVLLEHFCTT